MFNMSTKFDEDALNSLVSIMFTQSKRDTQTDDSVSTCIWTHLQHVAQGLTGCAGITILSAITVPRDTLVSLYLQDVETLLFEAEVISHRV